MEGARASLVKGKRVGGSSEGRGAIRGERCMERLTCTLIDVVWMSSKYRVCTFADETRVAQVGLFHSLLKGWGRACHWETGNSSAINTDPVQLNKCYKTAEV